MKWLALLLLAAPGTPLFVDIAQQAGLTHGGIRRRSTSLESTGSGVAVFDYDNDGRVDIFVVSGDGGPSRIYRNQGKLRFEETGGRLGLTLQGGAREPVPQTSTATASPICSSLIGDATHYTVICRAAASNS